MDEVKSPKVFMCYSSEDKRFVGKLAEQLICNGIDIWYDEWEIGPGDSFVQKIEEGLSECDVFVIIISENSVGSKWVKEEFSSAIVRRIEGQARIIPVRLDDTPVPSVINHLHWVKMRPFEEGLKKLLKGIFGIHEKPPPGEVPKFIRNDLERQKPPMKPRVLLRDLPSPFVAQGNKLNVVIVLGDELMMPSSLTHAGRLRQILLAKAHITDGIAGSMIAFMIATMTVEKQPPPVIISDWADPYHEELESSHLIVVGSPQVNRVTKGINDRWYNDLSIMPVSFRRPYKPGQMVAVTRDGKIYRREDDLGFLVLTRSCYSEDRDCLIVAGLTGIGTWAAAYELTHNFDRVKGIPSDYAIVRPLDADRDGVFDSTELVS